MTYKLGVIGGMGSEATSYFFEELVLHTEASKDQEHIDTVILNHASLPDRTEAILSGETQNLIEELILDVELLKNIGVDHIVIPCNTSHYFYDKLQSSTDVPIINMIRESVVTAKNLRDSVQKIGIMATTGTIQSRVYHKECERLGLGTVVPSQRGQEKVMSLIYDDIKKGKSGDPSKFEEVYEELVAAGSDVIILACTELSVFKKTNEVHDNCLDALDVLVKQSIEKSNKNYL